jgi:hypothetical protein
MMSHKAYKRCGGVIVSLLLLTSCVQGHRVIAPPFVGRYEGYVSFVDGSAPVGIRLTSAVAEVSKEQYTFSGTATLLGKAYGLTGVEQARGLMEYLQPAAVPTFGAASAYFVDEAGQTVYSMHFTMIPSFNHDGIEAELYDGDTRLDPDQLTAMVASVFLKQMSSQR